jgi:hypothetical protein
MARRAEVGGAVYSTVNRLVSGFAQRFNLSTFDPTATSDDRVGLWNGVSFDFETSFSRLGTIWRALQRYGLSGVRANNLLYHSILPRFERIYERLFDAQHAAPLASVDAVLDLMQLKHLTRMTLAHYLRTSQPAMAARFVNEMVEAMSRVNYGQGNDELHALVGLVSMVGGFGECRGIVGGNSQMVRKLVEHANASTLMRATVTSVEYVDTDKQQQHAYRIEYRQHREAESAEMRTLDVDYVIIACPLDVHNIDLTRLPDIATKRTTIAKYQVTHTTLVTGTAKLHEYFHVPQMVCMMQCNAMQCDASASDWQQGARHHLTCVCGTVRAAATQDLGHSCHHHLQPRGQTSLRPS